MLILNHLIIHGLEIYTVIFGKVLIPSEIIIFLCTENFNGNNTLNIINLIHNKGYIIKVDPFYFFRHSFSNDIL